jgi:hypothetical protein
VIAPQPPPTIATLIGEAAPALVIAGPTIPHQADDRIPSVGRSPSSD